MGRGRQKKRWEGNIKECARMMEFANTTRAAELKTELGEKGLLKVIHFCNKIIIIIIIVFIFRG